MIKRYLLFLIAIITIVSSVQGLALDMQNPSGFSAQLGSTALCTRIDWIQNASGGNSYIHMINAASPNGCYAVSATPLVMTYSAATTPVSSQVQANLLSASLTSLGLLNLGVMSAPNDRMEVYIVSGTATLYKNGVADSSIVVSQNPSYIGWGSGTDTQWDDIIWGSTESRYIFGMPETGDFLMKDVLNPAASGFYQVNQTNPNGSPTLIYSNYFPSTFGKNNGNNETVVLTSPTGSDQLSYQTGTKYAGQIYWNLTQFFAQNPPYGLYQTTINPQNVSSPGYAVSDWIPYIGSGASVTWDKTSYAVGETATITAVVSNSYYTALHNYNVTIQDVFGGVVNTDTSLVFTQPLGGSGDWIATSTYTWASSDLEGAYYGLLYGDLVSDNSHILMGYATTSLSSNLIVSGYVKDAETTNAIANATVNVTQGSTTDALMSGSIGNYTTVSQFAANAPITIVAGKSGYETYQTVFTSLAVGTIDLNITLMPTNPTHTGIALGGIVRTPPFNRTIDSATVTIKNGGTEYLATTNSAGYYIQNSMPNGTIWDVWGSKTGFANSSIYQKLVVGS